MRVRCGKCERMQVTEKTLRRMLLEGGHINGVFQIWVIAPDKRTEYEVIMLKGVVINVEERELSVTNTDPRVVVEHRVEQAGGE